MYKVLKYLIKQVLFNIFKILPRNKNIWIFRGFADSFIDNSKYLFLYINKNHSSIKVIWITRNEATYKMVKSLGYQSYMQRSFKGYFYSLVSKFQFYSDYNDYLTSAGAITINLWHGTPIKKIEFDITQGLLAELFNNTLKSKINFTHLYRKPDYFISSSEYMSKKIFSSAFKINEKKCLNFGYPRNDIMIQQKTKNNKYYKIFIYLPTWRDNGKDFIQESGIDFKKLNKLMKRNNSLFLLKLHPATKINIELSEYSNINLVDKNIDLYELLPSTDVLITDYSSVFFDYMLLKKDIIFFPFDYDEYIKNREFYFEYNEIIPSNAVFDFDSLCNRLFSDFEVNDKYKNISNKAWEHTDFNASKRITNYFLEKVKE